MLDSKIAHANKILRKLKSLPLKTVMFDVYYLLIHSHLVFNITVCGRTFPSYVKRL